MKEDRAIMTRVVADAVSSSCCVAEEVAFKLNISPTTARKYLSFAVGAGLLSEVPAKGSRPATYHHAARRPSSERGGE